MSKLFSYRTLVFVTCGGLAAYAGNKYGKKKLAEGGEHHSIKPVDILKGYQPIMEYLGEPINYKPVSMREEHNFFDGHKANFAIPVRGPKGAGILYYWSSRQDAKDEWTVDRLDFKKIDKLDERWTFYLNNCDGRDTSSTDNTHSW